MKKYQKTITVTEGQRALLFKNEQFQTVLPVGQHRFWDFKDKVRFKLISLNAVFVSDADIIRLYREGAALKDDILHWKLSPTETGLLYFNDILLGIVAPNEHVYVWKAAGEYRLDPVNVEDDVEVKGAMLRDIERSNKNTAPALIHSGSTHAIQPMRSIRVDKQQVALVFFDGQYQHTLQPGHYGYWQFMHDIDVRQFDLRTRPFEVSGQEILSKDRVSLRINLSANIRISDPMLAATTVESIDDFVYQRLQLALREAVGTKTLDDILLDKLYINQTVREWVIEPLAQVGVALENVGVKDIILPGEMKAILNQVVEAQKAAEANVIKRREETAATRSLHNTAKVMENNPVLMRLKELEALEKVSEKINNLTVYGGLDGLMQGVVKLA
ncbi:slipin family protein [Photobacterium japonica]|uniref:slipin family protein n=1 Tax=Photobacterium japonica TaxID=2910235 RepID=UPI003D14C8B1